MKYYVDSDGVLFDTLGWNVSKNPKVAEDITSDLFYKAMVEYPHECFIESKPFNSDFWELLRKHNDWYVLTALCCRKHLEKYLHLTNYTFEELIEIYKENKYLAFEKMGVPRNKVIIVDEGKDKTKYAIDVDGTQNVLFDDYEKNCERFKQNGGLSFCIKR